MYIYIYVYVYIYVYIYIYALLCYYSFVAERLSGVIADHHCRSLWSCGSLSSPALLPHPISTGGVCPEIAAVGGGQGSWCCMDSL